MSTSISAFLSSFRSRWGAVAAASCAGPLSLQIAAPGFITPWPERAAVTGFATISCAVALLLAYEVHRRRHALKVRLASAGLGLSVACLIAYLSCWSMLLLAEVQTSADGSAGTEILSIRGFTRLPEIRAHYPDGYPDRQLWSEFQYRVESVWTGPSIALSRGGTLLAYLGFFFCLTFAVALLGSQDVRPPARRASRSPADPPVL